MTATQARLLEHRTTVDDYLGPGDRRFFGKGYKRADQQLHQIRLEPTADGSGTARARAQVGYPTDWSRKGKSDQAPHLSSIDVLLIAGELTEAYLVHTYRLDADQRQRLRLSNVSIKAGNQPVEDDLTGFAVDVTFTPGPNAGTSRADCQVGNMRVRLDVEHPHTTPATDPADHPDLHALLGPPELRPFAHAHKHRAQRIDQVSLAPERTDAGAVLTVRREGPAGLAVTGLESHSHRGTSLIDAFVTVIQLGQILLYEFDQVDRADSSTLWMRHTLLESRTPGDPGTGPLPVATRLEDLQVLTNRQGDQWRCADIVGDAGPYTVRCSVAHRLPTSEGGAV